MEKTTLYRKESDMLNYGKKNRENVILAHSIATQVASVKNISYYEAIEILEHAKNILENNMRAQRAAVFIETQNAGKEGITLEIRTQKEFVKSAEAVKVSKCIEAHKKSLTTCFHWPYGREVETWKDENGDICIRYMSGNWFHYKIDENGTVHWW